MWRTRNTLAALVASILALSGCGGAAHHPPAPAASTPAATSTTTTTAHASGLDCRGARYTMPCALFGQPLPPPPPRTASGVIARGIDFSYSCPNPAGHDFGASYLSDSSKDWTRACLKWWHGAGAKTVAVRETTAARALQGCAAGAYDARRSAAELATDGAPPRQSFTMAIDFDASGPDVAAYFRCAQQAEPGRVNAYGGALAIDYLCAHHLVGHLNWATYAWLYRTGYRWPAASCAPLEQYLNSTRVDYDRAIAANYGQWPYAAPKPADPLRFYVKHRYKLAHGQIASEYNTVGAYRSHGCRRPERRTVCRTSAYHARLLAERDLFVATHHLVRGHWRKLKHPRWSYPSKRQPLGSRYHGLSAIAERLCPTVQSCMP